MAKLQLLMEKLQRANVKSIWEFTRRNIQFTMNGV
jgi:hypothetical protein